MKEREEKLKIEKITRLGIVGSIFLVAIAIFYYLVIYTPQQQKIKQEQAELKRHQEIQEKCITQTLKDLKDARPKMETPEITKFRVANDRGCFLEAGCMQGVEDEYFKPQFSSCNNEYYQECLSKVKAEVEQKIEAEKQKRISECIELYQQ